MDYLSFKEKIASVLCFSLSFIALCSGVYDFLIVDSAIRELILSVGVFLLLLSVGLTPKMFFLPLAEIFKGEALPSIVNSKLPQWFSLLGIFCCGIGLVSF